MQDHIKKVLGSGRPSSSALPNRPSSSALHNNTIQIISNDEMKDIIKIVNLLKILVYYRM